MYSLFRLNTFKRGTCTIFLLKIRRHRRLMRCACCVMLCAWCGHSVILDLPLVLIVLVPYIPYTNSFTIVPGIVQVPCGTCTCTSMREY